MKRPSNVLASGGSSLFFSFRHKRRRLKSSTSFRSACSKSSFQTCGSFTSRSLTANSFAATVSFSKSHWAVGRGPHHTDVSTTARAGLLVLTEPSACSWRREWPGQGMNCLNPMVGLVCGMVSRDRSMRSCFIHFRQCAAAEHASAFRRTDPSTSLKTCL